MRLVRAESTDICLILVAVDKPFARGLMWFRRDLRVQDNAALYHAPRSCREVVCAFVFDRAILDALPRRDRRVEFIQESVLQLQAALRSMGGDLVVRHAVAEEEIASLARQLECRPSSPTVTTSPPRWTATPRCSAPWPTRA